MVKPKRWNNMETLGCAVALSLERNLAHAKAIVDAYGTRDEIHCCRLLKEYCSRGGLPIENVNFFEVAKFLMDFKGVNPLP